ncbi:MAG: hypothetical protein HQM09_11710 [Candidatus Riflebacteria bacterium]|nr:hypothetical protein [Candidatus Riflebacteria bacterium]
MIKKRSSHAVGKSSSGEDSDREFIQLKQALQKQSPLLESLIRSRFKSPMPWKFAAADFSLTDSSDTIDLVFEHTSPEDPRYVLVHLSIPYLHKGQKFSLESKARLFQKQKGVTMTRIKKAILLIKKPGDAINASENRLHCPIIEIERDKLIPPVDVRPATPIADPTQFSEALLEELKAAIVRECLATIAKRRNKYIRKGLWRWIEREIVDPNVHFFLVILSCIYQGNTSEVLSRKFKSIDDFCKNPQPIIDTLFSDESELAGEIIKNAERHKKALAKFLDCFSQMPPFEYLRSLFLKEFRTSRDSMKSRAAVFNTLKELLNRCGFTGEKEIQYPLEILDELSVFQGLILGDYSELRIENAIKKLRHLVPQIAWTSDDVYRLRDELGRLLGLPTQEFNLNAFLPQAFVSNLPAVPTDVRFEPIALQSKTAAHTAATPIQSRATTTTGDGIVSNVRRDNASFPSGDNSRKISSPVPESRVSSAYSRQTNTGTGHGAVIPPVREIPLSQPSIPGSGEVSVKDAHSTTAAVSGSAHVPIIENVLPASDNNLTVTEAPVSPAPAPRVAARRGRPPRRSVVAVVASADIPVSPVSSPDLLPDKAVNIGLSEAESNPAFVAGSSTSVNVVPPIISSTPMDGPLTPDAKTHSVIVSPVEIASGRKDTPIVENASSRRNYDMPPARVQADRPSGINASAGASANPGDRLPSPVSPPIARPSSFAGPVQPPRRPIGPEECDESRHRNFEFFGGHLQKDDEAIRFALEMDRQHNADLIRAKQTPKPDAAALEAQERDDEPMVMVTRGHDGSPRPTQLVMGQNRQQDLSNDPRRRRGGRTRRKPTGSGPGGNMNRGPNVGGGGPNRGPGGPNRGSGGMNGGGGQMPRGGNNSRGGGR